MKKVKRNETGALNDLLVGGPKFEVTSLSATVSTVG